MAKVQYKITATDDLKRTEYDEYGRTILVFETEVYDDNNFETAESSADRQNDMLWEMIDHEFTVWDENGNEFEYDESGYRK